MAARAPKKEEATQGDKVGMILAVVVGAFVLLFVLAYVVPKPTEETRHSGIKVVSEIPLNDLRTKTFIALYNTTKTNAELTCKFELSAISKPDPRGYKITIGTGETGIILKTREANIYGRDEGDILRACHVFACLRDGVSCPDFESLEGFFKNARSMSIILDGNVDKTGGMGYAEMLGGLGYLQSQLVDANGDNQFDQAEIDANEFFIYPFVKEGDTCVPQPLVNLVQNWSRTNRTSNCGDIAPAIVVTASNETAIRVVGDQVIVSGSGDALHTASIIVRDVIAPEEIRRLYGYK
jgi:hypothetical protein